MPAPPDDRDPDEGTPARRGEDRGEGPQETRQFHQLTRMMMKVGPAADPLVDKLEPAHITEVIKNGERENQRRHDRQTRQASHQF